MISGEKLSTFADSIRFGLCLHNVFVVWLKIDGDATHILYAAGPADGNSDFFFLFIRFYLYSICRYVLGVGRFFHLAFSIVFQRFCFCWIVARFWGRVEYHDVSAEVFRRIEIRSIRRLDYWNCRWMFIVPVYHRDGILFGKAFDERQGHAARRTSVMKCGKKKNTRIPGFHYVCQRWRMSLECKNVKLLAFFLFELQIEMTAVGVGAAMTFCWHFIWLKKWISKYNFISMAGAVGWY